MMRRQEIVDLAVHLNSRRSEHDQVVAHPFEVGNEMGAEDDADLVLDDDLHQRGQELATSQRVQAGDRFIQQEQRGRLAIASVRASCAR